MNKDALSEADVEPFRASQGRGGDGWMITPFQGQELKEEAPNGPLGGTTLRMHPGLGWGWEWQSGDDGGWEGGGSQSPSGPEAAQ